MSAITQQIMSYGTTTPVGSGTTWSPTDKTGGWSVSNGNVRATVASVSQNIRCTRGSATGEKLYAELPIVSVGGVGDNDSIYYGLCLGSQAIGSIGSPFWLLNAFGSVFVSGGSGSGGSGALVNGDYLMFAYDHDNKKVWVGANGTWRNSGNPAAGTGQVYTFTTVASFKVISQTDAAGLTGTNIIVDFNGGTPYQGTIPSGFTNW